MSVTTLVKVPKDQELTNYIYYKYYLMKSGYFHRQVGIPIVDYPDRI